MLNVAVCKFAKEGSRVYVPGCDDFRVISITSTGCVPDASLLVRMPRIVTSPCGSTRAIAASLSLFQAGVACQGCPSMLAVSVPGVDAVEAVSDSAVGFIAGVSFSAQLQMKIANPKMNNRACVIARPCLHYLYR